MTDTAVAPTAPTAAKSVGFTARDAFELELRRAKVLAASTLLPEQYRDNLPNCMIAMNMANRIGADVMQVAQNLYIVHGKPGWSGQFLIATFNQCGKYSTMRFEWKGKQGEKEWGCRAWAIEKSTGDRIDGPWVTWTMVEAEKWNDKSGSKWKTMPELMFHYRAGAFLVRTHAPEIAMGLQTVEELGDTYDGTSTRVVGASQADELGAIDAINGAISGTTSTLTPPAATTVDKSTGEITKPYDNGFSEPDKPKVTTNQGGAPFSYPEIAAKLNGAKTGDDVDEAESLIDSCISDAKQRTELHDLARARRLDFK